MASWRGQDCPLGVAAFGYLLPSEFQADPTAEAGGFDVQAVMDELMQAGPHPTKRLAVLQAWFERRPDAERLSAQPAKRLLTGGKAPRS